VTADETKKNSTPGADAPEETAPEAVEADAAATPEDKPKRTRAAKPKADEAAPKAAKAKGEKGASKSAAKAEPKAEDKPKRTRAAKPKADEAAETEAPKKPARKKPAAKAEAEPAETKAAEPEAKPRRAKAAPAAPVRAERQKKREKKKALAEARQGSAGRATVVDTAGKELETRDLRPDLFAVPADVGTLHLVVRAEQAGRRRGTASTKTRGEVSGSTAKLFRQKGTGRARAGSIKSPLRTGGGVVFGPKPRDFSIKVNRKVVKKALAMALSNRAENGHVFVASGLELDAPSTARVHELLVTLDIAAPVLIVTHDEPVVGKSVRNLSYAESVEVRGLTTEQVLRTRSLVLTEKAFTALNEA
jgi:large subunit ribosomal protein L4